MRVGRIVRVCLVLCVGIIGSVCRCGAEHLALTDAIQQTLDYQQAVEIARQQVQVQCGLAKFFSGPFDPTVTGSFDHTISDDVQVTGLKTRDVAHASSATLGLLKRLRLGTILSAEAAVQQSKTSPLLASPPLDRTNNASVTFRIDQPLLRNLCWSPETVEERVNILEARAVYWDTLQNISAEVTNTVSLYWDVVAAKALLDTNRESEERLEKFYLNTKRLIEGKQLARTEIEQPEAELAAQKTTRLGAEQRYYDAVQQLQLAMGYVGCEFLFEEENLTLDPFPSSRLDYEEMSCLVEELVAYARECRYDIRAASNRERQACMRVNGACNRLLPRVDVFSSVTAIDHRVGPRAANLTGAAEFKRPQKDWRIGVSLSTPLYYCEGRGEYQRRHAEEQQACLALERLQLFAQGDVRRTTSNLVALSAQMARSAQAVENFRQIVKNEVQKLNAGESTLFRLFDFENQLTNAIRRHIALENSFSRNLALLRLQSGTLLACDDNLEWVTINDVTQLPRAGE